MLVLVRVGDEEDLGEELAAPDDLPPVVQDPLTPRTRQQGLYSTQYTGPSDIGENTCTVYSTLI